MLCALLANKITLHLSLYDAEHDSRGSNYENVDIHNYCKTQTGIIYLCRVNVNSKTLRDCNIINLGNIVWRIK